TNPFRWAGQYRDAESGNYDLRARTYDPATAQFISRDPLESLTREPYGYVGGNPINRADPSGLCWPFCAQGVADFAGGVLNVLTLGHGQDVLGAVGQDGKTDPCSGWYTAGEITATAALIATPFIEGAAETASADWAESSGILR